MQLGSGRNWVNHLIELATGIHSTKYRHDDGVYITICEHFYENFRQNAWHYDVTDTGGDMNLVLPPSKLYTPEMKRRGEPDPRLKYQDFE